MLNGIAALCFVLALASPQFDAEMSSGVPSETAQELQVAVEACGAASTLSSAGSTTGLLFDNECGAPCSPNGEWGECVGYPPGCMYIGIGDCTCRNGHWMCLWSC